MRYPEGGRRGHRPCGCWVGALTAGSDQPRSSVDADRVETLVRRALSKILPDRVKRMIDRFRERRFQAAVGPAATRFVATSGLEVVQGPFVGMHYIPGLERTGALVAKLLGAYERELHAAVHEIVEGSASHLVDVGSAEGYYAVGFARRMPATTVYAYDIDAGSREACARLAVLNDVGSRVVIRGACTPTDLADFPQTGVVLLSDCEGYERTLLDPDAAPVLRHWTILVELHDVVDASISRTIRSRFAGTHAIELISGETRNPDEYPELRSFSPRERTAVLNENRPELMTWAFMRPNT